METLPVTVDQARPGQSLIDGEAGGGGASERDFVSETGYGCSTKVELVLLNVQLVETISARFSQEQGDGVLVQLDIPFRYRR